MALQESSYHFIASPNEDGDGTGIGAFFNDKHSITRGAKLQFTNQARPSKFLRRQVLEARNDSSIRSNGNQLQINNQIYAKTDTSISGPPTHLTAGNLFCKSKWFASSSNPH